MAVHLNPRARHGPIVSACIIAQHIQLAEDPESLSFSLSVLPFSLSTIEAYLLAVWTSRDRGLTISAMGNNLPSGFPLFLSQHDAQPSQ